MPLFCHFLLHYQHQGKKHVQELAEAIKGGGLSSLRVLSLLMFDMRDEEELSIIVGASSGCSALESFELHSNALGE